MSRPRFTQDWEYLAKKFGYSSKVDMLTDLYNRKGLSLNEIGERLGCSPHAVGRNLAKCGIDRRGKGGDNNIGTQTRKLFRLDQRTVMFCPFMQAVQHTHVSTSLLYKFRRLMEGENGVLHHQSGGGVGEIQHAE